MANTFSFEIIGDDRVHVTRSGEFFCWMIRERRPSAQNGLLPARFVWVARFEGRRVESGSIRVVKDKIMGLDNFC